MRITLNGESREVQGATTVAELLTEIGLGERPVAVERNAVIVPRAQHATTAIAEGDSLEVVQFVGGG